MTLFTILADNREQKPWGFESHPVERQDVTLATGDYTVPELCDYNEDRDTYYPMRCVERKSPDDFLSSLFRSRDRFQQEIKRASTWDEPLEVVIEAPRQSFVGRYSESLQYRSITSQQVERTVDSWADHFNVEWVFCESRDAAERYTFETLIGWQREAMF